MKLMDYNLKLLHAKSKGALAQLPYLARTIALVWEAARGWTILWAVLLLVQGLIPVAVVYLTRGLVDSLVAVTRSHDASQRGFGAVISLALLMGALLLLGELLRGAINWV